MAGLPPHLHHGPRARSASPWPSPSSCSWRRSPTPNPDGLEKVSADTGIDAGATEHHLADGPFADYGVDGVDNDVLATGLAGIVGIAATFVVGAGVLWLVRRRRDRAGPVAA